MSDPIREALEAVRLRFDAIGYASTGRRFPKRADMDAIWDAARTGIDAVDAAIALLDKPTTQDFAMGVLQMAPQAPAGNWASESFLDSYRKWWVNRLNNIPMGKPHPDTERLTKYRNSPGPTGYPRWLEDEISECRAAHAGMRCDSETLCNLHESKARGAA